jgi:hypothetical protein
MFKIIKKGANNFWHYYNNDAKKLYVSKITFNLEEVANTFVLVQANGSNVPANKVLVTDIIVIDETDASLEETFATAEELRVRLNELGYGVVSSGGGGIPEAPNNVNAYVRSALSWVIGYTKTAIDNLLALKQNLLVSGTNIKTINSESILGSGDIVISGGGSQNLQQVLENGGTASFVGIANPDATYEVQMPFNTEDGLQGIQSITNAYSQTILGILEGQVINNVNLTDIEIESGHSKSVQISKGIAISGSEYFSEGSYQFLESISTIDMISGTPSESSYDIKAPIPKIGTVVNIKFPYKEVSGDYDLATTDDIPSISGLATETYVNDGLDLKANLTQVGNLLREEFTFSGSQTFTLANNYGQVYSVEVQGQGALSTSQYTLVAPNQITILDTLDSGDYIVVIYSNAIAGIQPYYSQSEVDALLNDKFDNPTGNSTQYLDGAGTPTTFPTIPSSFGDLAFLDEVDTDQIVNHAVTNNKLANMNANTVKGRLSGNGTPQDIAMANLPISTATQNALDLKQNTITNPITGTGANGQVAFFNGETTQAGDNGLFWDNTNKRLGIGTTTPTTRLDVRAQGALSTDIAFRVRNSADTANLLEVAGNGSTLLNGLQTLQGTVASDTAPLGTELLTTGTGDASWTGTSFATGYTHIVGSVTTLTSTLVAVIGTFYQITYTVTGRTAGSFTISFGGSSTAGITATGVAGPQASTTGTLVITPTTDFNGTIVLSIRTIGTSSATTTFRSSNGTVSNEIRVSNINTNTFIGLNAGRRNTTGSNNTANGFNALANNTTGFNNTANGFNALSNNTTGNSNTANGFNALSNNTTGFSNTANGVNALASNTTGNSNTANGVNALFNNTTGSNNTANGRDAGRFIADGTTANTITNNSVFLGTNTRALADNQTNQIVIGNDAIGLGSNSVVLGNSSIIRTALRGQTSVNTDTVNASAQLQIDSTTRGFLPPRMTNAQRLAIASPAVGLIVYCTDVVEGLYVNKSTGWQFII